MNLKDKTKKRIFLILLLLAVLQFPIVIFFANTKALAFDQSFHEKEFSRYNPNVEDRSAITGNLIFYLRYRNADRSYITAFTKEEKAHLIEVKILMHRFLNMMYISMTLLIASVLILSVMDKKRALKRIAASSVLGGCFTLFCSLIFYLIVITDFDAAFTKFHHIFFRLGNWQFPPEYLLVTLYPAQFWTDIISRIMSNVLITTAFVIILGILLFWLYLYKEKKATKFFRNKEGIIYKIKNY